MEQAADRLEPVEVGQQQRNQPGLAFLTGDQLWFQTAFCLSSFLRYAEVRPPVLVTSDGTLSCRQRATLLRLFPGIEIDPDADSVARLNRDAADLRLPTFSHLLSRHVLLRKIAQVHPPGAPARMFLDSDMLFHQRPVALEQWLAEPASALFMTDVQNAYGYSIDTLNRLAGRPVPERLNTGVSALPAGFLDWVALERWLRELTTAHGTSYYMEQALFALACTRGPYSRLDPTQYIVTPAAQHAAAAGGVLHHYVDLSKSHYFRHAWRSFATPLPAA